MDGNGRVLQKTVVQALSGKNAHVGARDVVMGLTWKLAGVRPEGAPHTVFQLVNHMIFWQEWVTTWLDGGRPRAARHASTGWPGAEAPATRKEWEQTVRRFRQGLDELDRRSRGADLLSKRGRTSRLEMLHTIAAHTSYHVGQVAFLRQLLGAWPPPSGGVTW